MRRRKRNRGKRRLQCKGKGRKERKEEEDFFQEGSGELWSTRVRQFPQEGKM